MDQQKDQDKETIKNLRKKNRLLIHMVARGYRQYKMKEMEHRRVLMQVSEGLHLAALQSRRLKVLIQALVQEIEAKNAPAVAAPDSTN